LSAYALFKESARRMTESRILCGVTVFISTYLSMDIIEISWIIDF